ncbi:MAG: hypothetical protein IKD45_03690 [Clostridia bacterium]|nr:hypothetical protein [Clostridia bacterium]
MKRNIKIFALILSLTFIFAAFALSVFADEPIADTTVAEGATEEAAKGIEISINFPRFVNSLQYMWKGMLCIFIVIGVIILITYALNRVVNYVAFAKEEKEKFKEFKDSENN